MWLHVTCPTYEGIHILTRGQLLSPKLEDNSILKELCVRNQICGPSPTEMTKPDYRIRRGISTTKKPKCEGLSLPYLAAGSNVKNVWDLRRNKKNTFVDNFYYS
jgi:hypothetical protein